MPKVLIIDDEKIIRERLKKLLELEDYIAFEAKNGLEGLEVFQKEKPEIVLVDVKMPGMDGLEVTKIIKEKSKITEVIILTGHGGSETAVQALREGAFDYITKPIEMDVLEISIRKALEKQEMQRKLDEYIQNLWESKLYVENIIRSIIDSLIVTNSKGQINYVNQATLALLGYEEDELIGQSAEILFAKKDDTLFKNSFWEQFTKEGSIRDYDTLCRTKSGEQIPVSFSGSAMRDKDFKFLGMVGISRDMRETQRLLAETKEKQAQLVHSGRLASLGEMATGVAHELNQPLAVIRSNIQGLAWDLKYNTFLKEKIPEIVTNTLKQVDKAANIIDHMRAFARTRVESDDPIDIREPILAGLSMFKEQFRLHDVEIETQFEKNLPLLNINPQRLEQIVVNYLSNSRFAVEQKGKEADPTYQKKIKFVVFKDETRNSIVFEAIDNGIGMTKEVLDRCLEPFYTTKDVGEGTGLGLSIVYSIIKDLGGSLTVESTPGQGTTFRTMFKIGE